MNWNRISSIYVDNNSVPWNSDNHNVKVFCLLKDVVIIDWYAHTGDGAISGSHLK